MAELLQDNESNALPAPVCEGNCGAGFVVICQAVLCKLAYGVLSAAEFLLQVLVLVHSLSARLLQELPEGVHDWGCGEEWGKLIDKPVPRPDV